MHSVCRAAFPELPDKQRKQLDYSPAVLIVRDQCSSILHVTRQGGFWQRRVCHMIDYVEVCDTSTERAIHARSAVDADWSQRLALGRRGVLRN